MKKNRIIFLLMFSMSLIIASAFPIKAKAKWPKLSEILNPNFGDLDSTEKRWHFVPRNDGTPSGPARDSGNLLTKYNCNYLGDTSKKILYLTFDEGYENGNTSEILDILKANKVKAAFFVTTPYIKTEAELIKRMVAEGHLVCNHSTNHPSMASIKDQDKFNSELNICQDTFETLTGTKMPRFFRPPMGKYSELSLNYTKELGYRTIFWSFAYVDWKIDKQPTEDFAKKIITKRTHNGAIILLHAVSDTNTNILDSMLKEWSSKGYEFKTLNDLDQ